MLGSRTQTRSLRDARRRRVVAVTALRGVAELLPRPGGGDVQREGVVDRAGLHVLDADGPARHGEPARAGPESVLEVPLAVGDPVDAPAPAGAPDTVDLLGHPELPQLVGAGGVDGQLAVAALGGHGVDRDRHLRELPTGTQQSSRGPRLALAVVPLDVHLGGARRDRVHARGVLVGVEGRDAAVLRRGLRRHVLDHGGGVGVLGGLADVQTPRGALREHPAGRHRAGQDRALRGACNGCGGGGDGTGGGARGEGDDGGRGERERDGQTAEHEQASSDDRVRAALNPSGHPGRTFSRPPHRALVCTRRACPRDAR